MKEADKSKSELLEELHLLRDELKKEKNENSNLKEIINNSLDAILLTATDGTIYFANPAACRMYDMSEEEIYKLGRNGLADLEAPNLHLLLEERNGKGNAICEYNQLRKDGSKFSTETSSVIFNTAEGKRASIIVRDISERKKIELMLKESEEKFHLLFLKSPIGIVIANKEGKFLDVNESFCKMLGYTKEELINTPLLNIIHPDDRQQSIPMLMSLINNQCKGYQVERRYIKKDDTFIWVRATTAAMLNTDGKFICGLGMIEDITEYKSTQDLMNQSRVNYKAFFDTINDLLFVLDEQGNILHINQTAIDRLGYSEEELIGKPILMVHPPERREEAGRAAADMLTGKSEVCSIPLLTKSGEQIPVEIRIKMGIWNGNRAVFGVIKDISEIKLSEEKFKTVANFTYAWEAWRNPQGEYVYCSPACLRITGHSVEEFLSNKHLIFEITHQDDREKVIAHHKSAVLLSANENLEIDFRIITPDGETRWLSHTCVPVYNEANEWLGRRESNRDVTKIKELEYSLRLSEQKYRGLIDEVSDGFYSVDVRGSFTFANKSLAKILGLKSPEELIGRNIRDFMDTKGMEEYLKKFNYDIDNKIPSGGLIVVATKVDGSTIHLEITSTTIFSNQEVVGLKGVVHDISKRVNDEKLLKQWASVFEFASWGIVLGDQDGTYLGLMNPAFASMHGYSVQELQGKPISTVFAPESRNEIQTAIQTAHQRGHYTWESEHIKKDGTIFPVFIDVTTVYEKNGTISYRIVNVQDISSRKFAEDAYKSLAIRNKLILQTANEGIHILDEFGSAVEVNKSFCDMLGYTKEELLEMNISDWDAQWTTDELLAKISALLEHPAIFETRYKRKDGTVIDVEINANGILLDEKKYLYAGARDITVRKKAQERVVEAKKELEKTNAVKDKLFSIIAHDLKSPFQGIVGLTGLLAEDYDDFSESERIKFIRMMHNSIKNIMQLIENLLEWARMQKGSISFEPKELNLSKVVTQTINFISEWGDEKNIEIKNEVDENQMVFADEALLNSILLNLITNAIKFTHKGGKVVARSEGANKNMAKMSIIDTGVGMPESLVGKLFKMEERVGRKGTEGEESSGLGLLLCKEFVEKQGGEIWVESRENIGSIFSFTVPVSMKN